MPPRKAAMKAKSNLGMTKEEAEKSTVAERAGPELVEMKDDEMEEEEAAVEGRKPQAPPVEKIDPDSVAEAWRLPEHEVAAAAAAENADDVDEEERHERRRKGKSKAAAAAPPLGSSFATQIPYDGTLPPPPLPAAAAAAHAAGQSASGAAAAASSRERPSIQAELRSMMYGFGDDKQPLARSVQLVEELVVDYVHQVLNQAQAACELRHQEEALKKKPTGAELRCGRFVDASQPEAVAFRQNNFDEQPPAKQSAPKVKEADLLFALRRNPRRQQHARELLELSGEIRQARHYLKDLEKEDWR